jgi:hypothetical protein
MHVLIVDFRLNLTLFNDIVPISEISETSNCKSFDVHEELVDMEWIIGYFNDTVSVKVITYRRMILSGIGVLRDL